MRKTIIAGNWKMNKVGFEVEDFLTELCDYVDETFINDIEIIICPAACFLELGMDFTQESQVYIGAQNVSDHKAGAYTGEISASMLKSMDLDYCIIGHSERRNYFSESDSVIREKLKLLFENEITPIVCVGETLEQREAGETDKIIVDQLEGVFSNIDLKKKIVLAYEPVWAIGTGKTATPDQAQEIHLLIRNWLSKRYSDEIAEKTSILYGGSVTPENINDLITQADIDGGLIGGASLVIEKFINIIDLVLEQKNKKC